MTAVDAVATVARFGDRSRGDRSVFTVAYVVALLVALLIVAATGVATHAAFPLAAAIYCLGAVAITFQPIAGVYLIAFLTIQADKASAPWYPFVKNLSSPESIMYLHDSLLINPLEGYLLLTFASLMARVMRGEAELHPLPLIKPLGAFVVWIGWGLFWGLARGGDPVVALWEARPFVALVATYFLAVNLLRTHRAVRLVVVTMIASMCLEGVHALTTSWNVRHRIDSLVDHTAALHLNIMFVLLLAALLFRGAHNGVRYVMPLLAVPALWIYLLSERRAAVGALIVGVVMVFVVLKHRDPSRFWFTGPTLAIATLLYLVAFWNARGALGFPAQAIRSQIDGTAASVADVSSDSYRELEDANIWLSIRANKLTGIGFGNRYPQVFPLPDISSVWIWWDYITHNSVLYIWMKTGVFGIISMFYWLGRTLQDGIRAAVATADPTDAAILVAAAATAPMFLIYAAFDLAWDTETLVVFGLVMAVIARLGATSGVVTQLEST